MFYTPEAALLRKCCIVKQYITYNCIYLFALFNHSQIGQRSDLATLSLQGFNDLAQKHISNKAQQMLTLISYCFAFLSCNLLLLTGQHTAYTNTDISAKIVNMGEFIGLGLISRVNPCQPQGPSTGALFKVSPFSLNLNVTRRIHQTIRNKN